VLFRRALRSDDTARAPLTCRFPPGCNASNQNSVATSGNASTLHF